MMIFSLSFNISGKCRSDFNFDFFETFQVEENVGAALELETAGKDEKTFAEIENILKPIKNQSWPSGIQQTWDVLQVLDVFFFTAIQNEGNV